MRDPVKSLRLRFHKWRMKHLNRQQRFEYIYSSGAWYSNGESFSGAGSTVEATKELRVALPDLLGKLDCSRLIDLGCGDFNWMKKVDLSCEYLGVDIVESVIQRNRETYSRPGVNFATIDAVSEPIPSGYDVVLCREVLFHLSHADAVSLIQNVLSSNAKYFIATQIDSNEVNRDIETGGFRPIDLRLKPFSFPEPDFSISDDHISNLRSLGVWSVSQLTVSSTKL